jgi:uncharacterized membrane protein
MHLSTILLSAACHKVGVVYLPALPEKFVYHVLSLTVGPTKFSDASSETFVGSVANFRFKTSLSKFLVGMADQLVSAAKCRFWPSETY